MLSATRDLSPNSRLFLLVIRTAHPNEQRVWALPHPLKVLKLPSILLNILLLSAPSSEALKAKTKSKNLTTQLSMFAALSCPAPFLISIPPRARHSSVLRIRPLTPGPTRLFNSSLRSLRSDDSLSGPSSLHSITRCQSH
jgi:hypothetical protein